MEGVVMPLSGASDQDGNSRPSPALPILGCCVVASLPTPSSTFIPPLPPSIFHSSNIPSAPSQTFLHLPSQFQHTLHPLLQVCLIPSLPLLISSPVFPLHSFPSPWLNPPRPVPPPDPSTSSQALVSFPRHLHTCFQKSSPLRFSLFLAPENSAA